MYGSLYILKQNSVLFSGKNYAVQVKTYNAKALTIPIKAYNAKALAL